MERLHPSPPVNVSKFWFQQILRVCKKILGLKKFGVQKIICPKKFRAQKNFKAKDILFWKKIGVWKFFWKHLGSNCLENILGSICLKNFGFNFQKIWTLKVFWVWNNLGLKNAGSTKKIWPEINYGPKKFWVKKMFEKYFGSKKILG